MWKAQSLGRDFPKLSLSLIQRMFTLGAFPDILLGVDGRVTAACFDNHNHRCCGCSAARYQSAIGRLQNVFVCFSSFNSRIRFPPTESPLSPRAASSTLSESLTFPTVMRVSFFFYFEVLLVFFCSYVGRISHLCSHSLLLLHLQIRPFKYLFCVP